MTPPGPADAVRAIVDGMRARLADHGFGDRARLLGSLPADAESPVPDAGEPPERLPVLRHLGQALALAGRSPVAELAAAVSACRPGLRWTRTASYLRSPPDPSFPDRYAHAPLAGRVTGDVADHATGDAVEDGPPDVVLGLLLLAPHTHYPLHHHPADELYLPLTRARWAHGRDQEPVAEPAGVLLHHRPWQPHAMTTGDAPLLAVYLWTGDVTTPSAFC